MTVLLFLIPVALLLGGLGMWCFVWAVNNAQFDDLENAGKRILFDDADAKLRERNTR
jgi:cbb3-type cytochrome oxidase maturation protein